MVPGSKQASISMCEGQEDRKCASSCISERFFEGYSDKEEERLASWANWVHRRMEGMRKMCNSIDVRPASSSCY